LHATFLRSTCVPTFPLRLVRLVYRFGTTVAVTLYVHVLRSVHTLLFTHVVLHVLVCSRLRFTGSLRSFVWLCWLVPVGCVPVHRLRFYSRSYRWFTVGYGLVVTAPYFLWFRYVTVRLVYHGCLFIWFHVLVGLVVARLVGWLRFWFVPVPVGCFVVVVLVMFVDVTVTFVLGSYGSFALVRWFLFVVVCLVCYVGLLLFTVVD